MQAKLEKKCENKVLKIYEQWVHLFKTENGEGGFPQYMLDGGLEERSMKQTQKKLNKHLKGGGVSDNRGTRKINNELHSPRSTIH
jgi:hypothetical protein